MHYKFFFFLLVFFPLFSYTVSAAESDFPNGSLVKTKDDPKVYLIWNETKRHISNEKTFEKNGFRWKDIQEILADKLSDLSELAPIIWRDVDIPDKITVHEHYRTKANLNRYFSVARNLGIGKTIFLPTGMNPDNRGYKEHMMELLKVQEQYPKEIIAFCAVDEQDSKAAEVLEDCFKAGGQGLKILGGHPDFYDEPLDSVNMHAIFEVARRYKRPVLAHVSIINLPQANLEFKNLLNDYSDLSVIFSHYCSTVMNGVHLEQCADYLNTYPNLYVDLTMGGGIQRYFSYMKQDMQPFKEFVEKYQDRLLYGSDIILTKNKSIRSLERRMKCDIDLLTQEYYTCHNQTEKNEILPGYGLSASILKKIFIENAKKALQL
jgi:predicted TIM-barrel fold metal-dependent hydrolase